MQQEMKKYNRKDIMQINWLVDIQLLAWSFLQQWTNNWASLIIVNAMNGKKCKWKGIAQQTID